MLWLPVSGYRGLYEVSDAGLIRSFYKYREGHIMSPALNRNGYYSVSLSYCDIKRSFLVHRLVCQEFLWKSKLGVNHIDGNRLNNNLSNLEYAYHLDNIAHAHRLGLFVRGTKVPSSKLNENKVSKIRQLRRHGWTPLELQNKFKTSSSNIYSILLNQTWKHVP